MTQYRAKRADTRTPVQTVERLTQIASRLLEVLEEEAQVLKAQKPENVVDYHEEKSRLTNELAMEIGEIGRNPALLDQAPSALVGSMKETMARLNAASQQSGRLILAAKSISDGVIQTIAKVAKRKQAPETGYGKSGAMVSRGTPAAASVSLDARF